MTEQKRFKFIWLLQPILIALFPVIQMFAKNPEEISIFDLSLACILLTSTVILGFLFCSLLLKSFLKGALATNLLILLFYTGSALIPQLFIPISKNYFAYTFMGARIFRVRIFLALFLLVSFYLIYKLIRYKIKHDFLLKVLLLPLIALLSFSSFNSFISRKKLSSAYKIYEQKNKNFRNKILDQLKQSTKKKRDIYFIILDAYPSQEYLIKTYNFDNKKFLKKLSDRNFYIANKSMSNYASTIPSLSTTLNMKYHAKLKNLPLTKLWRDNDVAYFLQKIGYKYINLSPVSKNTDTNISSFLFDPLRLGHVFVSSWTPFIYMFPNFYDKQFMAQVRNKLQALKKSSQIKTNKFVYAHFMVPHLPHVFDKNGDPLILDKEKPEHERYLYGQLEEIKFINKEIIKSIDQILKNSKTPPIIILQSDHGSNLVPWDSKYHFQILNSYFLPDNGDKAVYKTISPVNNFRVIFNYYFETDLELLEDKNLYKSQNK